MKTVGIVGGIAPESPIRYYRLIISAYRERRGDGSYSSIRINSIDMKTMLDPIGANDRVGVTNYLVEETENWHGPEQHSACWRPIPPTSFWRQFRHVPLFA